MEESTPPAAPVAEEPKKEPKAVLLGRIHDVSEFASKDETRYVINSIHYDDKLGCVEATNGRALIRVPVTVPVEEFPPVKDTGVAQDVIIPLGPFKKALSTVPKNGPLEILRHLRMSVQGEPGMQRLTLTSTDGDTEQAVSAKAIEGIYPNTQQVITETEPAMSIALNPFVLDPIIEFAKKHAYPDGVSATITFHLTDSISPVRFEINCRDELGNPVKAYGVLMPMRLS